MSACSAFYVHLNLPRMIPKNLFDWIFSRIWNAGFRLPMPGQGSQIIPEWVMGSPGSLSAPASGHGSLESGAGAVGPRFMIASRRSRIARISAVAALAESRGAAV